MEPSQSSGILLDENRYRIGYLDKATDCLCRVTFDLTREHYVLIDCLESVHELASFPIRSDQPFQISFPGTAKPVQCHISGTFRQQIIGDDPSLYLTFWPFGDAVINHGSKLFRVDGGIVNFKQYHVGAGRTISLDDGIWKFELTPVGESPLYPAEIQNQSYLFSHHLLLQRKDGQSFSWSHARKGLETLSTFLSFCAERSIAAALVRGYDESGTVVIQDLGTPRVDPFESRRSWLDEDHGEAIVETFPGFARLMEDMEWRETIRTAIYWYVRGNSNLIGPDGAIILVQTALERLAWHILVRVRHSISERSFSDLPAADQLRLALDSCSVPLDLPGKLSELTAVAIGKKGDQDWIDGPQAFVAVRNQIVHPGKRKRAKGGRAFFEALELGKWYLELILLRSFQFNGSYACRLNIPMYVGAVEPVPWALHKI